MDAETLFELNSKVKVKCKADEEGHVRCKIVLQGEMKQDGGGDRENDSCDPEEQPCWPPTWPKPLPQGNRMIKQNAHPNVADPPQNDRDDIYIFVTRDVIIIIIVFN